MRISQDPKGSIGFFSQKVPISHKVQVSHKLQPSHKLRPTHSLLLSIKSVLVTHKSLVSSSNHKTQGNQMTLFPLWAVITRAAVVLQVYKALPRHPFPAGHAYRISDKASAVETASISLTILDAPVVPVHLAHALSVNRVRTTNGVHLPESPIVLVIVPTIFMILTTQIFPAIQSQSGQNTLVRTSSTKGFTPRRNDTCRDLEFRSEAWRFSS